MKKNKYFLLLLLFLAISTRAFAYVTDEIVKFGSHTYRVVSASAFTLAFLGTDDTTTGQLVIPATVNDGKDVTFTVTVVGGSFVHKCNNITSVVLPETIVEIKGSSFNNAKLESINIPKNVAKIDQIAFTYLLKTPKFNVSTENTYFTSDADGVLYSKDMSTLYAVPSDVTVNNGVYAINENVTYIKYNAVFLPNSTKGLKTLIFPKNLQQIDMGWPTVAPCTTITTFEIASGGTTPFRVVDGVLFKDAELVAYPRAKNVVDYKVPDGITSVATYALYANNFMKTLDLNQVTKLANSSLYSLGNLITVTLPKGLEEGPTIEGCIESCNRIKNYIVPSDSENYYGENGIVFSKDKKKLYFYPPAKDDFTTYTIPATVEIICRRAFQQQAHLVSITIPKTVTEIREMAFRGLQKLTTVTFEETSAVTTFGEYAFSMCDVLKEFTLPSSLTEISDALYLCKALEVVNVPNGSKLKTIRGSAFVTNSILRQFNFLGTCELTAINSNAFANLTKLESFTFPKSVVNILANAFSGCTGMATATFADDAVIQKIGAGAFANSGITAITIPLSVTTIEKDAFRNCNVLTTVNVSQNMTNISPEAFKSCWKLTDITVDKKNTVYSSIDGYLLSKDKQTLILFPPGKANSGFTLLPPSITKIGDYSFYECTKLENVVIPNKVTSIGKRAFGLCTNLNTIAFLCDAMIDPTMIDQGLNTMSFDDGTNVAATMFTKIDIFVRKDLLSQYQANTYYQKFKSIGTSFASGNEEYLPVSATDVDLLSTTSTDYTYVLPTSVQHNGKTYNVGLIGDYAFQTVTSDIKEVVVKDNVRYIGAKAFMTNINNNTSTIQNVFFIESQPTNEMLSTTRFELDETGDNYNEFASTTKIYVKKSALNTYKAAWTKTVYNTGTGTNDASQYDFTSQLDYKIPGVTITQRYGTFAREFDTDFSDYATVNNNSQVAAFVAGSPLLVGTGDYGTSTYYIRMTSIDVNGGYNSYSYVPAGTGVLLKVLDRDATGTNFYYTIGEQDNQVYNVTNNIMVGTTVNPTSVAASESSPVYVMQGGIFRKATSTISNFPVHKAYLQASSIPAGAKVIFEFDDSETTSIQSVNTEATKEDGAYYNLNGQRVENPQKGVYIHQGKKIIIK